jgi:hypothetical protein
MHPQIAKTLVDQRREELMHAADHHSQEFAAAAVAEPGWLNRHLPRWHVSWSRTVLSPAGVPETTGSSRRTRRDKRGSSLVIIISAYRSA